MKAILNYKYGTPDVLHLEEAEKPTQMTMISCKKHMRPPSIKANGIT